MLDAMDKTRNKRLSAPERGGPERSGGRPNGGAGDAISQDSTSGLAGTSPRRWDGTRKRSASTSGDGKPRIDAWIRCRCSIDRRRRRLPNNPL
jgi:hypothetical protein